MSLHTLFSLYFPRTYSLQNFKTQSLIIYLQFEIHALFLYLYIFNVKIIKTYNNPRHINIYIYRKKISSNAAQSIWLCYIFFPVVGLNPMAKKTQLHPPCACSLRTDRLSPLFLSALPWVTHGNPSLGRVRKGGDKG